MGPAHEVMSDFVTVTVVNGLSMIVVVVEKSEVNITAIAVVASVVVTAPDVIVEVVVAPNVIVVVMVAVD